MQTENVPQPCPSCGHTMEQKFCSNCGEKRVHHHDFSLKHFAEEALENITHFDSKFFRTIKVLITQPGKLAEDFSNGIRVRYMRPLQLFIVCNLIFFVAVIYWTPFSQPLNTYWVYRQYAKLGTREIIKKKVQNEITNFQKQYDPSGEVSVSLTDKYFYSIVENNFNRSIKSQSKIFLIILVPLNAFLFMLFFPRKRFIGEHFVLATHFMSAMLVYFLFAAYLVNLPVNYFFGENSGISSAIAITLICIYLAIAFKRFYKVSMWRSISGTLAVGALTVVLWTIYRMLLFYNIMFWM
jgi:hypothetical protein